MKGLIIKPYWGSKILKGEKIWEIRGTNTNHRGHTEIIYSGSGHRYGCANLVNCFEISKTVFKLNSDKHQIEPWNFDETRYKKLYAWIFEDAQFHDEPIAYTHPQGAVIWVKLEEVES